MVPNKVKLSCCQVQQTGQTQQQFHKYIHYMLLLYTGYKIEAHVLRMEWFVFEVELRRQSDVC